MQSRTPLSGSTGKRSLDIGFIHKPESEPEPGKAFKCCWSDILVPGELKSNPSADKASQVWINLVAYVREVFCAQDTRRFILGFTLCGSLMRVWAYDRLGPIVSGKFDINKDSLQFVFTILGFLCMNEEQLGFDPIVKKENGRRFIEIERNSSIERLVVGEEMNRARCIVGRATTCWKAYREGDPQTPLVIKDSWQYPERDEEGMLLREATDEGVVRVARYYHHETVQVRGTDDDIQNNVRQGLDITTAGALLSKGASGNIAGVKRSSSHTNAPLPSSKRSRLVSSTKAVRNATWNRVHRRVILRDFGKPIYKASSITSLLTALEGCIEGHESLRKAGFLHKDISINNLMINEDDNNSWSSFLIDLDLAIREQRDSASGAGGMTDTKAFMAIGVLMG